MDFSIEDTPLGCNSQPVVIPKPRKRYMYPMPNFYDHHGEDGYDYLNAAIVANVPNPDFDLLPNASILYSPPDKI